jgi:hypothetical protein
MIDTFGTIDTIGTIDTLGTLNIIVPSLQQQRGRRSRMWDSWWTNSA